MRVKDDVLWIEMVSIKAMRKGSAVTSWIRGSLPSSFQESNRKKQQIKDTLVKLLLEALFKEVLDLTTALFGLQRLCKEKKKSLWVISLL